MRSRIDYSWMFDCSRKNNCATVGIFYLSAIVISYITLVMPGVTYVRMWMNDVMALLNAAYRVSQGQVPYLDFHTIYGPLVFYIPALGLRAGLNPSVIFAFDGVVVATIILLAGWLTMYRRFTLPTTLITLFFLWLLIVVPMASGWGIHGISWGTYYNRHCWAALAVTLLFYVEPEDKKGCDKWIDSVVLSSLVIFLLYTKITFGIVGFVFVLANIVTTTFNRRVSLISITIVIAAIASVQMGLGFNGQYLDCIRESAGINPILRAGLLGLTRKLINHLWLILACIGTLLVNLAVGRRHAQDWAYVFGVITVSFLLLETTGGTSKGLPTLIAVFVCCGELTRRTELKSEANGMQVWWRKRAGSLICLFLAVMFVSEPVAARLFVWHDHYTTATRNILKPFPDLPPALSGFLVPLNNEQLQDVYGHDENGHDLLGRVRQATDHDPTLSAHEYFLTIVEGVKLLRGMAFLDRTLFVLDNADPFTVALNLRPTPHGYPLLWAEMVFSPTSHPAGQEVFSGVDWVMVPVVPYHPKTKEIMMDIYGDYLRRNYDEIRCSPHWKLLAKKSG